jgi:chromosomal replication initiator protein
MKLSRALLGVKPDATGAQIEEAYLTRQHELRKAFLELGGFERLQPCPHHSLDRFVEGPSNRLAVSAIRRVCDKPGHLYNPLLLHGPTGVGKSHLLGALDNELRRTRQLVMHTSAERFTDEFIRSVGSHQLERFHDKYRGLDVLLLDCLHVLGPRQQTQEELIGIVDHMVSRGKQVVVTSLVPVGDLCATLGTLCSRLRGGLVVELQSPDLETRRRIVKSLAERYGLDISADVTSKLASRVQHDVRLLDGAVRRLAACRGLLEPAAATEEAGPLDDILSDLLPARPASGNLCVDAIMDTVGAYYGLDVSELCGATGAKKVQRARQIAMYLCRELTEASLTQVGAAFRASANQVLYATRVIKNNLEDPMLARDLKKLRSRLARGRR